MHSRGSSQERPAMTCYAVRPSRTTRSGEYAPHHNGRRPHRARGRRPPRPMHPVANLNSQRIKRQRLLGGLINEYERAA